MRNAPSPNALCCALLPSPVGWQCDWQARPSTRNLILILIRILILSESARLMRSTPRSHRRRHAQKNLQVAANALDDSHYLRIYMGHLRHKLEDDPAQPRFFLTETAVGYRLMPGN